MTLILTSPIPENSASAFSASRSAFSSGVSSGTGSYWAATGAGWLSRRTGGGFHGLNAVYEGLLQNAPANCFEDETEQVSFEVFTLACDHNVNVGGTVGMTNKC